MKLDVGSFTVNSVDFSDQTQLTNGKLELDKNELLQMVLDDPKVLTATLDIVSPGESTRIIGYGNVIEPKLKVAGQGQVYPGVCGRPTNIVGSGVTYRMEGVSVIECIDRAGQTESYPGEDRQWGRELSHGETSVQGIHDRFIDMVGRGAVTPYAELINICLVITPINGLDAEDQHFVAFSNALRLSDRVAETMKESEPDKWEHFDTMSQPGLPNIVYIPHMASTEPIVGPKGTFGTSIYGQVRLSAPWQLSPTELLDGAVCGGGFEAVSGGGSTWIMSNNPVVLELLRRHGKDVNFQGVLVQRTNWTNQSEYQLVADRTAYLAKQLGAEGAILTTDIRGQRWVGTMLTLQACELAGINVVLLTEEEDNENGGAPPLLFTPDELQSAVSTGTGDVEGFDAVDKVIGEENPNLNWFGEIPQLHGRYGRAHVKDYYGFGSQSYGDTYISNTKGSSK